MKGRFLGACFSIFSIFRNEEGAIALADHASIFATSPFLCEVRSFLEIHSGTASEFFFKQTVKIGVVSKSTLLGSFHEGESLFCYFHKDFHSCLLNKLIKGNTRDLFKLMHKVVAVHKEMTGNIVDSNFIL